MRLPFFFIFLLSWICSFGLVQAETLCEKANQAWLSIKSYQCDYIATTLYEGKQKETEMLYSYAKPNKIRMDISKPKQGAVLIYNPEITKKVRVRPFPSLKFMILKFDLIDPKVSSDNGGTIDESDLGTRMQKFCSLLEKTDSKFIHENLEINGVTLQVKEEGQWLKKKYYFNNKNLLEKIEVLDSTEEIIEKFEWKNFKANFQFKENWFKEMN